MSGSESSGSYVPEMPEGTGDFTVAGALQKIFASQIGFSEGHVPSSNESIDTAEETQNLEDL